MQTDIEKQYTSIYCVNFQIGSHTEFSASIYNTIKLSIDRGMYATQFFLGNPKSYNRHQAKYEDIQKAIAFR